MSSIYSLHTRSQFYSTVGEGLILQSNGVNLSKYCMSPWYKSCIDSIYSPNQVATRFIPKLRLPRIQFPLRSGLRTLIRLTPPSHHLPSPLAVKSPWSLYLSPDLAIVLFFSRSPLDFSCFLPADTMATATSVFPPLESRPLKDTIVLFDVDETLTKARRVCDTIVPGSINAANNN